MHLVLYSSSGELMKLAAGLTWLLLIGAGYGFLRLVLDVIKQFPALFRIGPKPEDRPTPAGDDEVGA